MELGQIRGSGIGSPPVGSRGEAPAGGLGTESPEAGEFLKIHNLKFKALCENERHNLMPLMAFFCSAHCTPALCCFSVMFYSSIQQCSSGVRQGAWGRSPPEAGAFFLKYTA